MKSQAPIATKPTIATTHNQNRASKTETLFLDCNLLMLRFAVYLTYFDEKVCFVLEVERQPNG